MKSRRLLEVERYVTERETVTMEELKEAFQVSMNTVRRDVAELVRDGILIKVYGGVTTQSSAAALVAYEVRSAGDHTGKRQVGNKAAEMVEDGDIIFLDSGTTTVQMMDGLREKRNLTIVTHNLEVMLRAVEMENIRLIALPGQLRHKTRSMTGDDTVSFLSRYNISKAFMAATGISEHGVTNSSRMEYEIKKKAVEISDQAILMVCGGKFGVTSLMTYAQADAFSTVITDAAAPVEELEKLRNNGIHVVVAGGEAEA
ncbi:MAG: DeoR/GlpR transcriptional regulator [Clostridia bacterium]|nr:DeoR/GlpR transcriptional regulator [Clostridia bacterium]